MNEHDARLAASAVASAVAPGGGEPTTLQRTLIVAAFDAMTGYHIEEFTFVSPTVLATQLDPDPALRTRLVQLMILGELVLNPLPLTVADRVADYAQVLGVTDDLIAVTHRYAEGCLGLARADFERCGYVPDLNTRVRTLGLTETQAQDAMNDAWGAVVADERLANRWAALNDLPSNSLGRHVARFYDERGFQYPGLPGSASPLLAQHDWVHVLADYGTTLEAEIEVFGFIARANDDPRAFTLLAMVVSLFQTGMLGHGAGLFDAAPGHLDERVAVRLADAMRRGALTFDGRTGANSVDFLAVDWFALAPRKLSDVRELFNVVPRSAAAIAAGSASPWEPGGISPFQLEAARKAHTPT